MENLIDEKVTGREGEPIVYLCKTCYNRKVCRLDRRQIRTEVAENKEMKETTKQ